jgi:hypothetical protein
MQQRNEHIQCQYILHVWPMVGSSGINLGSCDKVQPPGIRTCMLTRCAGDSWTHYNFRHAVYNRESVHAMRGKKA